MDGNQLMNDSKAGISREDSRHVFHCRGAWTVIGIDGLIDAFSSSELPVGESLKIDGDGIKKFDSAGALALIRCKALLEEQGNQVELSSFSKKRQDLIELVQSKKESIEYVPPPEKKMKPLDALGKETLYKLSQIDGLVVLIGDLSTKIFAAFGNLRRFQFPSIVSIIYSAGIQALPIVGLLSFLIGVVLAYQLGQQLENYGASTFIAFLSGMANFREFGPLITAIIVAGRTSSSFTAQLGSMKINEEIDALRTMGLSPTELLVMPKVIGMLLVFPLLIFFADVFCMLGSMVMSKNMLGVGYIDFLNRLRDSVGVKQMMLGLYKAPTFAIVIALVGCFQGFKVEANADSIGSQTTKSVVQALFLIIIVDAAYSIIYSWMNL